MQDFNDTVTADASRVREVHESLDQATEKFVHDLIEALAQVSSEVRYLDDLDVHTIDRHKNSSENHINQKEVVSGDATAWFSVADEASGLERIQKVTIQYGVYAGWQGGDFKYDPVKVAVTT